MICILKLDEVCKSTEPVGFIIAHDINEAIEKAIGLDDYGISDGLKALGNPRPGRHWVDRSRNIWALVS